MQQWASWYLDKKEIKSVYFKPFVKNRNESEKIFVHLAGEPSPEIIQVRENGITFLVEPYSDWSTGLFLDQKENRLFTGSLSTDKKVLNLFSYTCSFSVYAAYFNSVQVTSVDLSRRFLERGKENFRANKLNPENHLFFCEDVFSFLKRANKKKNQYDLIILDPPSFSRNKEGKVFTIEKDLEALIRLCDGVLSEGGVLFCSSNYEGWDKKTFENIVNRAVGKGYRIMKTPALEGEKLLVSCQRRVFASAAKQSH
jgi:23S rRNA (cytosine1962-C5)-methyltransferase